MSRQALQRAVDTAGGQKPLADKIGTTQSNVWYWLARSKNGVPAEWVGKVAEATGVPKHELRPDLYPPSLQRILVRQDPMRRAVPRAGR